MSTTAPDARFTTYTPVVPTTEFPALFPIFANGDISVFIDGVERSDFTVTASYTEGVSNNAKVIMNTGVTGKVLIVGDRDPRRQNRFGFGPIPPRDLNLAFDTVEGEMQETRRDIDRSVRSEIGEPGYIIDPGLVDGDTPMKQGNRLVPGPNLPDLAASLIAEATAQANRSHDEADRSEAARDIAAGYASDAVSQGNVPIYSTVAGMSALQVPAGIRAIRVNGGLAIGDGHGGYFIDIPNGMPQAFISGGSTSRPFYSSAEDVFVLRADWLGASDVSGTLNAAAGIFKHILIPTGVYRVENGFTVPEGVTVEFARGAVLEIQTGAIITWNGGIKAGAYQHIFSGAVVQSAYTRIGDTPYTFALQGSPQIEWASPFWFGAKGDWATDDEVSLYCAQYFGGVMYVPPVVGLGFKTSKFVMLRRDGMRMFGDGFHSRIGSTGASIGAVTGFRGDPPVTASGGPARTLVGCTIEGIHIDGADAVNNNGVGGSHCRDCKVINSFFSNIGRKAITWQYHVRDCEDYGNTIYDASTEAGSTHAALSFEGQTAGLNYSAEGGVSNANDLFGADVTGIKSKCSIESSGYNYVSITRARDCSIEISKAGSCFAAGRHVVFGAYAKNNTVKIQKAGNTERSFVATIALSEDNYVEFDGGDAVGTGNDGYAINDAGARNYFKGRFDHSNVNTAGGRAVNLAGVDGVCELNVRSCDSSTILGGTGTGYLFNSKNKLLASAARIALIGGVNWTFEGGYYDPGTGIGIQVDAAGASIQGARILGAGANRVLVSSGIRGWIVADNYLPGANAEVTVTTAADLWAGGSKYNNQGDIASLQCIRMGKCIIGTGNGTPEGSVSAEIGSQYTNLTTGIHYSKVSGSGNTGWVVTGTQT